MSTRLHVTLSVSATTTLETEPLGRTGPRLRIGDGQDAVDIYLPFTVTGATAFLRNLAETIADLNAAITEHGTAYSAPAHR